MEELVQEVVRHTRIPEDKARRAVQVVLEQLEQRVPGPFADQIRSIAGDGARAPASDASMRVRNALDL